MDQRRMKAFEFASESANHPVTLEGPEDSVPSTRAVLVRIPAVLQTVGLAAATVLLVYFGVRYTE